MSWLLPWLHRPTPLAQRRKAETSGGEADSEHGNGAGVGSQRNDRRSGIRTIVGTHFALTSSRPGHTRMPPTCTWDESPANQPSSAPLSTELRHHTAYPANQAGSHLGSTLNPGGAVLTLGVFRRSRSVACIRADASPSEVHTTAMVPLGVGARQADWRPRPWSVHVRRCAFWSTGGRWPWHDGHVESISRSAAEVASGRARSGNPRHTGHACRTLREGGAGPAASWERHTRMVLHLGGRGPALGYRQSSD